MSPPTPRFSARSAPRHPWARRWRLTSHRAGRLDLALQGLLWMFAAGIGFVLLNTMVRYLTTQIPPLQSQFLRYLGGLVVMLPLVARHGLTAYKPKNIQGQFTRGAVHTVALGLWFVALPQISLADMTALGFTTPIFIMLGAWLFLREPMHWDRWVAAGVGLLGVLIVVGAGLNGQGGFYNLVMLASCPMFAASFLITKALTRYETPGVIVLWQALSVAVLSLPLALVDWHHPNAWQWAGYLLCGVLGSGSHYCLTRAYMVADISATQSLKFLDLVWASLMGWLVFSDRPSQSTLMGGVVICAATLWIARRESRRVGQIGTPK